MKSGKKLISCILGLLLSTPAIAVDGYKNLKFGMSTKQIMETNICTFKKTASSVPGVEIYTCNNFKFGGETVEAGAFFIDNKFKRLFIVPSMTVAIGLGQGLSDKYGAPSSSSPRESFAKVDNTPNTEAYLGFDGNTVLLRIMSDENNLQSAFLIYTSSDYEKVLGDIQKKSLSNDL